MDLLAAHYGGAGPKPALQWQIAHLRKDSAPLAEKAGARGRDETTCARSAGAGPDV